MAYKTIDGHRHMLYSIPFLNEAQSFEQANAFYEKMNARRSVREFSTKAVAKQTIEKIIQTASTAPSGAHKQPWTFCAISNSSIKREIRLAAEKEEEENYNKRMSARWKEDLKAFGTNPSKPFLETAPWLIAVFKQSFAYNAHGQKSNHYYVNESVGIACGLLISAIHHAGLVTLTHTPSPMNFLSQICDRPENEKPYLLLPVGYPETPCYVPDIQRKSLSEIAVFYE
ncbi:nitroreductase family protein [Marinilongibacter aquaticus]|uniref:nitroreductase family protein n=1 Tax=Marinilongibacter aquaticus TaxID=2975157 RepID=UPI0021BDB719|nr:nitroreductase family protein [Marinilongibacter aquaticus]UBM58990.1 nitroreductase family protein [Marinilongibacter aquaticus]